MDYKCGWVTDSLEKKVRFLPCTIVQKINSRQRKNLNVKGKILKLLQGNIRDYIYNLGGRTELLK